MNQFNERDYWIRREQHSDMARQAERERLVALVPTQAAWPRESIHRRALRWLGARLVEWGCRLQDAASSSVAQSCGHIEQPA